MQEASRGNIDKVGNKVSHTQDLLRRLVPFIWRKYLERRGRG